MYVNALISNSNSIQITSNLHKLIKKQIFKKKMKICGFFLWQVSLLVFLELLNQSIFLWKLVEPLVKVILNRRNFSINVPIFHGFVKFNYISISNLFLRKHLYAYFSGARKDDCKRFKSGCIGQAGFPFKLFRPTSRQ